MIVFQATFDPSKPIKGVDAKCIWFRVPRSPEEVDPDFDALRHAALKVRFEVEGLDTVIEGGGCLSQQVHNPILTYPKYFAVAFDIPLVEKVTYKKLESLQKTQGIVFLVTIVSEGEGSLPPRKKKGKQAKPYGYFWQYICNPANGFHKVQGMQEFLGIDYAGFKETGEALTRALKVESKGNEVSPEQFVKRLEEWSYGEIAIDLAHAKMICREGYKYWRNKQQQEKESETRES